MSLPQQIAGIASDVKALGKLIPSYQRGVVANVSPPTVVMDRDVTATPRPVADVLVPGLAVGQRVEVRVIGSRRVITSIHPADNEIYVSTATASDFWTPRSGVTTVEARAVRQGGVATIYLRLSGTAVTAGVHNIELGTIKEGWRPSTYFMPWEGWAGSGHAAMGLVQAGTGSLTSRWSSGGSNVALLSATYPAEPWPA